MKQDAKPTPPPRPGECRSEQEINSNDLIAIMAAGQYEDDLLGNSTWEEGDWNGDGDYDSADFVIALQTGLHEVKSPAVGNPLAATVDWLFAQDLRPARRRAYVT